MSRSKARRAARRNRGEQSSNTAPRRDPVPQGSTAPEHGEAQAGAAAAAGTAAAQGTDRRATAAAAATKDVVALSLPGFVVTDEDFASRAEQLMREYSGNSFAGLTTTKLRGIYALIMNVYTRASTPQEFEGCKGDIQYLKVRMAYEAGRERSVNDFLGRTHLMELIGTIADYRQFALYCRYAEALVAYFKFFGGKDS